MAKIVTFVPDLATWHPPGDVVEDILTHLGAYTHLVLFSWAASGPKWTAAAWVDHNTFPANAVVEFHRCGIKIMVSAGNAETRLISDQPNGGYSYGSKVGEFVRNNDLDGVNFEITDPEAFGAGRGVEWVVEATRGAREVLGRDAEISHTVMAPDFWRHSYLEIEREVGELIDFYNVRFFENPAVAYDSYRGLFELGVDQIIEAGVPNHKIVVGKPVMPDDTRGGGYVAPEVIAEYMAERRRTGELPGGIVGWQWLSDRKAFAGRWSKIVAEPFLRESEGGA